MHGQRALLLARNILGNRERPDLAALARIEDPERFIWAILPHAARTFSLAIVLLPARSALHAAVAYLYCRMLDTYEDLVPEQHEQEAHLAAFAARFDNPDDGSLPRAAPIERPVHRDERDRAHLLLLERAHLVDSVFLRFDDDARAVIAELVREMSRGMRWSSATFGEQGGVLTSDEQLTAYCRHVLGNPVLFMIRLLRLHAGRGSEMESAEDRENAMLVGELTQLANVTRDIEKDLRRGIAYDASLRADLGRDVRGDPAVEERVRAVRERLLRLALLRAPAYTRLIEGMRLPRVSLVRASAIVMLLFTEKHFRRTAERVGLQAWRGPDSAVAIVVRGLRAAASEQRARAEMARVEKAFLACARS